MQAIKTRMLFSTNTKPDRIKATCSGGTLIMSVHKLVADTMKLQHAEVAVRLCKQLGWYGQLVVGNFDDDFIFCFTDDVTFMVNVNKPTSQQ